MASNLSIALTIGASVASAISGVKQLGSSISSLKSESLASSKNITNLAKASVGSFQMAIAPIGAVGGAIMGISQPAIAFETAMADVKKVVDFDTPEQFKEMREDILALTRDIPMSAEEIAQIVAAGGQSNIARENLLGYATDAAKMGVAFDMAAGSAGTAMATMANVLNKPISEMAQFGDAINHLSDNANSKAADIVNVITRAGSDMRLLNMAEEQSAALASTFLSMGKAPELAAQAMKGISASFQQLKAGENEKALKKIGLTTKGFAKSMNEDAQGAITDFIERIKSLPSDMQYSFAADIFGKQYADDILLLTQNTEEYRRQLQLLQETDENGELAYIGSMQREFENQSNTTANNLRLLQNSFSEVGIAIGDVFLPVINKVVNQMKPVLVGAADWLNANQHILEMGIKVGGTVIALWSGFFLLTSVVTGTAAAILSWYKIIKGGFKVVFFLTKGIFSIGKLLTGVLVKGLVVAGKALLVFGRALMLNPIGLLVTAIAAAAYLIWRNWDWLKTRFASLGNWFGKLWNNIKGFFSSGIANITATIVNWSPLGLFYDAFSGVLSWFGVELPSTLTEAGRSLIGGLVSGITSMFSFAKNTIDTFGENVKSWIGEKLNPAAFVQFGKNIIDGLISGINSSIGKASKKVGELGNGVKSWFSEKLRINSPSRVFAEFGIGIVDGFTSGVDKKMPAAEFQSQELADSVTSPFENNRKGAVSPVETILQNRHVQSSNTPNREQQYTIHFNPTIEIGSNSDSTIKEQVQTGLKMSLYEFEKLFKQLTEQQGRRSYI